MLYNSNDFGIIIVSEHLVALIKKARHGLAFVVMNLRMTLSSYSKLSLIYRPKHARGLRD